MERNKKKFQLLFIAEKTEFEFKSYELERLGKHFRLSIKTPEGSCYKSKDNFPVWKTKLKQI